jgi:glutathione S-transferase
MKLYQFAYSPYAAKVRKYLELQRRTYEIVEVPYMDRNEVAQLSGQIVLPVLVDGSTVVADSARITAYLDGPTRDATAVVYEAWADSIFEDVAFRLASPPVENKIAELNGGREDARAMYRFIKERKFGTGCIAAWAAQSRELVTKLRALLAPLAQKLQTQPFLLGETPTLADAAVWGNLYMLEWATPGWVAREVPEVSEWYRRV